MPPEALAAGSAGAAANSAIYVGEVVHRRWQPRAHHLRYRMFYFLLDLDELAVLDQRTRWFACNRGAPFSFHDRDHGAGDGQPLRAWIDGVLTAHGLGAGPWHYRVLTLPRVLGYVFNPISAIYCHDAAGELAAMVYEVNNTYGERVSYVVAVDAADPVIRQRCDKSLFVSPFFDLAGDYAFTLNRPGERLHLRIDHRAPGTGADAAAVPRLRAAFSGRRYPFSAPTLRALAWRFPAATLKVSWAIHYEALKLWLKGVPVVAHVRRGIAPTVTGSSR